MTLVLFYIIKGIIDGIKDKSKLYFAMKIQEYEDGLKKEKDSVETNNKYKVSDTSNSDDSVNNTFVYVENRNDYEIEDVFLLTKLIDKDFSLNTEDLIINFISKNANYKNYDLYDNLVKLQERIDDIGLYSLVTNASVREAFIDLVKSNYKNIYKDYTLVNKDFDINNFISYVKSELDKNNPSIYVFVGREDENYDKIDDRIKTIYDNSIYKGFKIVYKNKLYDYSLG